MNRPRTALICGLALFVDIATLPEGSRVVAGGPLGLSGQQERYYGGPVAEVVRVAAEDGGGVRVVPGAALSPSGATIGYLTCQRYVGPAGWWAGVEHVDEVAMVFDWSLVTAAEATTIREDFAAIVETHSSMYAPLADRIRAGDLVRRSVRPIGYVHNFVSLLVAAGLCVGLVASVRRFWEVLGETNRARDSEELLRGRCPRCGYDVGSIQRDAAARGAASIRCPECGAEYPL